MKLSTLNWLRAGVLGANDGIISIAVILVSVVGVITSEKLLLVGLSGILAGSLSMAIGEYVSVSAQRDAEKAASASVLTNPTHAALSSFLAFVCGALIPFLAVMIFESKTAVVAAVFLALIMTTFISVKVGKTKLRKPLIRNMLGGTLALTLGIVLNSVFS